jgi:hypothetical protein
MPVGMFRSEEGWVQVDYGTGNIPITINCRQKRSIGPQRKRRKMMPGGPKGEKRLADVIGRPVPLIREGSVSSRSRKIDFPDSSDTSIRHSGVSFS